MREVDKILARANVYGVFALTFTYPEDEAVADIRSGEAALLEALELIGVDSDALEQGLAFVKEAAVTQPSEMRRNYNELFVGRKQCRLDESEYDKSIFYRFQRIADVAGFYRAFGFELAADSHQRADFVGTELEFMHVLLLKQAYAVENGWHDQAEACNEAERKFFREHLEWWIPSMCQRLRGASSCTFYKSLSDFLESFIRSEESRYLQPA